MVSRLCGRDCHLDSGYFTTYSIFKILFLKFQISNFKFQIGLEFNLECEIWNLKSKYVLLRLGNNCCVFGIYDFRWNQNDQTLKERGRLFLSK